MAETDQERTEEPHRETKTAGPRKGTGCAFKGNGNGVCLSQFSRRIYVVWRITF